MPLHLLGKKSWNVYNPQNIARVKADEAAAAASEAAEEQRMQELDAERRAALLRGQTPPPLPEDDAAGTHSTRRRSDRDRDGDRRALKRRRNEDDTDRDIRLASSTTSHRDGQEAAVVRLRQPKSDAPLTDHAGNINLFPVDVKEIVKREKNAEVEAEKRKNERRLEDQYTMRLSNAAGREGGEQPWYTDVRPGPVADTTDNAREGAIADPGFGNKDVWGNEDPLRKERQKARITSNDPLAMMNQAQSQLKRAKQEKKQWRDERERELMELRSAHERQERRHRHRHSKHDLRTETRDLHQPPRAHERSARDNPSEHRHRRSRSRSRSRSPDRIVDRKSRRNSDRVQTRSRSPPDRHRYRERDHRPRRQHNISGRHRSSRWGENAFL